MVMIPAYEDDLKQEFTFETLPSKTFRLNANGLITGTVDQREAVKQAVFLILNTGFLYS